MSEGRCGWCNKAIPPTKSRKRERVYQRKFCSDAHAAKFRRAQKAEGTADIVQRLEPYVSEEGRFVFRELVDHLSTRVNESV